MMPTRWNPMMEMQAEVNRLRSEMERMWGRMAGNGRRMLNLTDFPPVNLWEEDDALIVEAELPGLALDDLEIFVSGGTQLAIKGERKPPAVEQGVWHRKERGYGKFTKIVELPVAVAEDEVVASFKLGVLSVKLPKRPEAKPRKIEVKAE